MSVSISVEGKDYVIPGELKDGKMMFKLPDGVRPEDIDLSNSYVMLPTYSKESDEQEKSDSNSSPNLE